MHWKLVQIFLLQLINAIVKTQYIQTIDHQHFNTLKKIQCSYFPNYYPLSDTIVQVSRNESNFLSDSTYVCVTADVKVDDSSLFTATKPAPLPATPQPHLQVSAADDESTDNIISTILCLAPASKR